jgi:hypothetical protein
MLAAMDTLSRNINPEDILISVMWSGTDRKAWYIDNPVIIQDVVGGMPKFNGGMSRQFLDLKNQVSNNQGVFKTFSGSEFDYSLDGGWYFTVNGSDCKLDFVQTHYLMDGDLYNGIGKIHSSLENIVMLQNYCKLKGVKLINQFFMDHVFEDIETKKEHQLISYLYKQLNFDDMIIEGMFEYLHTLLGIERKDAIMVTHDERIEIDKETKYFNKDGFHPSDIGNILWCENILFPFLKDKI